MRKLLALASLLFTAACAGTITPPKPPTPPPAQLQTITAQTGATGTCSFTVTSTAPPAVVYTATQSGDCATSVFSQVPFAATTVRVDVTSDQFLPASGSADTAGDGKTTINIALVPVAPKPPPLPPIPTRDQLANIHAAFQGVFATSSDLGTVPSWGPDAWMHPLLADRQATYAAHKAAGATHLTVALDDGDGQGYQEAGVAYPNNKASGNVFGVEDHDSLCQFTAEVIQAGLYPLMAIGGDNDGPTFDWVHQHFPGAWAALGACKQGDLRPYVVPLLGFDSVDELAQDNGSNVDDLILFVRGVIGPNAVLAKENQSGWAFWSGASGPGGVYGAPAAQALDVILQEFDAPPGPPQPAPSIIAGVFDSEHNDYAPVFSDPGRGQSFMRIWQVCGRTCLSYHRPPDQVNDIVVTNCSGGGPDDGGSCHTGADGNSPPCYTCIGTPRGRFYIIGFEYNTYNWVRLQVSVADVVGAGLYLSNAGYDQSAGPTSVTSTLSATTQSSARTLSLRAVTDTTPHHMVMHKGGALPPKAPANHIGGGGFVLSPRLHF